MVDLDRGTALFAKRVDVRNWNDACVAQIENRYTEACEAVDIVGCDPYAKEETPEPDKRVKHGIQTLPVLKIRTHPDHRMRLMLHNLNTQKGWVNGTRVRLLEKCSWSGEPRKLRSVPGMGGKNLQKWEVAADAHIALADEKKYPEFNMKVVKDEDIVLEKTVAGITGGSWGS